MCQKAKIIGFAEKVDCSYCGKMSIEAIQVMEGDELKYMGCDCAANILRDATVPADMTGVSSFKFKKSRTEWRLRGLMAANDPYFHLPVSVVG